MNTYRWCCSVIKSGLTLCDPTDCSTPGFPVLHLSPGVCSNSGPLSQWCYPIISSSVAPFSSCLHSFPASESFPMSQFFSSSSQITGASASPLPTNIQDWLVKSQYRPKDSKESFPAPQFKNINSSAFRLLYGPTLTSLCPYITARKTIAFTLWTFINKVMPLLFNMLSQFAIAFLLRSKHLLISCPQSLSTVILEQKKIKSLTISTFSPICHEVMETDGIILVFWMLNFKSVFFYCSLSPSSKGSLVLIHFLP